VSGAAISVAALGLAAGLATLTSSAPVHAAGGMPCGPPAEMLGKGLDAYKASRYEIAIPSFECVIRDDNDLQKFYAEFYLARVLSDDTGGFVDHAKAYTLFQGLADTTDTVDPDDKRRAPFVAKAVNAVAGYVRRGLPEIGLKADPDRAIEWIRQSATLFDEPDSQFELAKLHLAGQGVPLDVRVGLHYIQKLVQESHPGAQAYLADLHWNGKYVSLDHVRALALIKLASDNAGPSDRLWIDDRYQNFYCGTRPSERMQAAELLAGFRRVFARGPNLDRNAPELPPRYGLGGGRDVALSRTCANGERIDKTLQQQGALAATPPLASSILPASGPQPTTPAGVRKSTR
jgi:uncharacterized protein